jgi:glycosyltransferase involved in cell wall biosynthesis
MIIEEYGVGLLADGGCFRAAISRLLDGPALREELGRTARRVAETAFSWTQLTERLQDFYAIVLR